MAPLDVLDALRVAYVGEVVGTVYEGDRSFDVAVRLSARDRRPVGEIGLLPLRRPC